MTSGSAIAEGPHGTLLTANNLGTKNLINCNTTRYEKLYLKLGLQASSDAVFSYSCAAVDRSLKVVRNDLEDHSRSLEMVLFDRPYITFYLCF